MLLKGYILNMIGLNLDLVETIRKIVREELEDHQEKVSEIIKSQLTNTNERLAKF